MATVQVVQGFSQLNRALIYTSAILAPAQAASGVGHFGLSNLGFVAYNFYTQIIWFRAASNHQLSALSLVTVHANTTLALAYLGGICSGNRAMAVLLAIGAIGVLWLNNATAWISWKTGQEAGYGEWQFFFFGWRTLSPGWHKFIMIWQIFNSIESFVLSGFCVAHAIIVGTRDEEENERKFKWWHRFPIVLVGGVIMVFFLWPYILWIELTVRRNRIESETDWVAVYIFVVQVALLLLPDFGKCLMRWKNGNSRAYDENQYYSLGWTMGLSD